MIFRRLTKACCCIMLFIMLIYPGLGVSQCYERLFEVSGFVTEPYQTALNEAACKLIQTMPEAFRNNFKVFSCDFYVLQHHFKGFKYPQAFEAARVQAAGRSQYYLLLGRQSDPSGIFTRFWVDVKLPDTGDFSCIDRLSPANRNTISAKHQVIANDIHRANDHNPFQYKAAELGAMKAFQAFLEETIDCCDPEERGNNICEAINIKPKNIIFKEHPDQKGDFDDLFGIVSNKYLKVKIDDQITAEQIEAKDAYKAVQVGTDDKVLVETDPTEALDGIYFYTAPSSFSSNSVDIGVKLIYNKVSKDKPELIISGTVANAGATIKCKSKPSDTDDIVYYNDNLFSVPEPFQMHVKTYPLREVKLGVRVVHETDFTCTKCEWVNQEGLQEYLTNIYAPAIVDVKLTVLEKMTIPYDLANEEGVKDKKFSYDTEKQIVIEKGNDNMYDKIIFLIGNPLANRNGISQADGRYAFVHPSDNHKDASDIYQTIAHELGHLLGSTKDYSSSIQLNYLMYRSFRKGATKLSFDEWESFHKVIKE
jgi:rRNA processing protein Gar1